MEFKKEDLTTAHVVQLRNGIIGAISEMNGKLMIVKKFGKVLIPKLSFQNINDDLKCNLDNSEKNDIIKVADMGCTFYAFITVLENRDVIWSWERSNLKPITTLDQLEEVRKGLCIKYQSSFYITNKHGEWEIINNGILQLLGSIHDLDKNVINIELPPYYSIENTTSATCGKPVYLDWEVRGGFTENPHRAINLEKEGFVLALK